MKDTREELENLVWKTEKKIDENGKYKQSEIRLIDMSESELKKAYNHCVTMLFNNDFKKPGRYNVLNLISDQRSRCGAELFLRYVEQIQGYSRISLMSTINTFLNANKEVLKDEKPPLDIVFTNLPNEFIGVPLDLIIDGCLDRLGAMDKSHITRAFILRQGLWLTSLESKDLTEIDKLGTVRNRIDVIKERLNLKPIENIIINSKGLNYTELRAMINLKPNKKYRDLTTVQLETLRNKILFILEQDVKKHIDGWESRMDDIEKIAKFKEIKL